MHVRRSFSLPVLSFLAAVLLIVGCGTGNQQEATPPPIQSVVKFSSQPPTAANEGDVYTYTMAASDAAGGTITYTLSTAPTGATITGNQLTWTPTSRQSRIPIPLAVEAKSSAGGSASQHWMITPTGTIRGSQIVSWWKEDGTQVPIKVDLTGVPVNAILSGSTGFITLPGVGKSDGTFAIPKVPAGYFWLQFGRVFFWTSTSQFDAGHDEIGRPDVRTATYGGTANFNLTNLSPFDPSHAFQWYSQNARTLEWLNNYCSPLPSAGDSTLSCSYPVHVGDNLIDASKGDSSLLTQLIPTNYLGNLMYAPVRYFRSVVTEVDGGTATLSGSFADVISSGSLRAKVMGSQFHAMVPALSPKAVESLTWAGIRAMSFGTDKGPIADAPYQMGFWGDNPPLTSDADLGDVPLVTPNAGWPAVLEFEHWAEVDYNAPGVSPYVADTLIYVYTTSLPTIDKPIQPVLGPIGGPTINGADLLTDQTVTGLTPTLSWTAPVVGKATGYIVRMYQFTSNLGPQPVARFYTTQTSFQIPDGVLQAGAYYYFAVDSRFQSVGNPEINPYRYGFPQAGAQTLSGVLNFTGTTISGSKARRLTQARYLQKYMESAVERRFEQRRPRPLTK